MGRKKHIFTIALLCMLLGVMAACSSDKKADNITSTDTNNKKTVAAEKNDDLSENDVTTDNDTTENQTKTIDKKSGKSVSKSTKEANNNEKDKATSSENSSNKVKQGDEWLIVSPDQKETTAQKDNTTSNSPQPSKKNNTDQNQTSDGSHNASDKKNDTDQKQPEQEKPSTVDSTTELPVVPVEE